MHAHAHGPGRLARGETRKALALVLALTVLFGLAEAAAGWLTGSLALLADAGHMASDASSLALALAATWLAQRPATPRRSFGYARAEVLAALANGLALVLVAALVVVEAWRRLDDPPDVLAGPMLAVAVAGLGLNAGAALLLHRRGGGTLNARAALRHVLADLAGSVGVIAAALVVLTTGRQEADPVVAALVGLLIAGSAWGILRETLSVLLETTPRGLDAGEIGHAMAAQADVVEVHDLHVWTITSGFPALAAHVLVRPGADCHLVRLRLEELLRERFAIEHTTLQVEHAPAQVLELGAVERRRSPLA